MNYIQNKTYLLETTLEKRIIVTEDEKSIINNMDKKEIHTSDIGELVMQQLKDVDEVAYVRFASVYREFKDVNTFMDELKKILK